MDTAEGLVSSASDGGGTQLSSVGSGDSESGYDTGSSDDNESDSEASEEAAEDNEAGKEEEEESAAVRQRVRADLDAMRGMMTEMDKIKMRLQFRFAVERQARLERLARDDLEREQQAAARRRAGEEARSRRVETSVQTDGDLSQQQQTELHCCPQSAEAEPPTQKAKPAGLSLYDLVKASRFDKTSHPVRRTEPTELPSRSSTAVCDQVSPLQQQQKQQVEDKQTLEEQPAVYTSRNWRRSSARNQDSVGGGAEERDSGGDSVCSSRAQSSQSPECYSHAKQLERGLAPPPQYDDENASSVSNSILSDVSTHRAATSSHLRGNPHQKRDVAALFGSGKSLQANDNDKTEEQREMEAIQCLLFGYMDSVGR